MTIQELKIINFRNYSTQTINFSNKLNIIYGNNGSGKSNIIEAIYYLGLTKSFRTNQDNNLLRNGEQCFSIIGNVISDDQIEFKVNYNSLGKNVYIDGDRISKLSDYITNIKIILFNPLDTIIITDTPSSRRKMLDISLAQNNKSYLLLLNSYNKLLKQRNAYIKQLNYNANASLDYLNILTEKLVSFGIKINEMRKSFISSINENISKIYLNIFEEGELKVNYISTYSDMSKEALLKKYQTNYQHEIITHKTSFGIHQDDVEFVLDDHNIKNYGSVGQQKNAIISYKLAELLLIKKQINDYPILILDDLFSELDGEKINNIVKMLNREVQTFITTTDIKQINKELLKDAKIYKITSGNIIQEEYNGK